MTGIKVLILGLLSTFFGVKYNIFEDIRHDLDIYVPSVLTGTFTFMFVELPTWITSNPYFNSIIEYLLKTGVTLFNVFITVTATFFFKQLLTKYFGSKDDKETL